MIINKQQFIYLFLGIVFLASSYIAKRNNPKPVIKVSEQERQVNFNPVAMQMMSLGQERLISSSLWVQTLMDGDIEHYKSDDLNSWMFLKFKSIISLDPRFYEAYLWGGKYLSIIKDDVLGAEEIYKRGLIQFPNDLDLNFNAGFNRFFELNLKEDAIVNFEKVIATNEGIKRFPRLVSLVNKMKSEAGVPFAEIFSNIELVYKETKDKKFKKYLLQTLYSIRATEDLQCLNAQKTSCRTTDLFGQEYTFVKGSYSAPREFQKFKVFRNSDN